MSTRGISSADARNLVLDEPLLLDPAGEYPEFSPDGEEVLFAKSENEVSCLWRVNRNGGDKRKLVCPANAGIWSPDGSKIAVIRPDGLSLFDLRTQQSVALPATGRCWAGCLASGNGFYWTRDGKKIFFLSREGTPDGFNVRGDLASALDLDDLVFTEFVYNDANQWLRRSNTSAVLHPKVDFGPATEYAYLEKAGGIWISNRDQSFQRLLLLGNWEHFRLAPDLSALVFSQNSGMGSSGIYIATLHVQKSLTSRVFSVALSGRQIQGSLPKCRTSGPIRGLVDGARVNPLNGKTVGPDDTPKGVVEFTQTPDNEVKVIAESLPIATGDVLSEVWRGKEASFSGFNWTLRGDCQENVADLAVGSPEKHALEHVVILQPAGAGSGSAETAGRAEAERNRRR